MTVPIATRVAIEEPEIAPKSMHATTTDTAIPPGRNPTNEFTNPINRLAEDPAVMMAPIMMKNKTAKKEK